jgi:hypothetical protein
MAKANRYVMIGSVGLVFFLLGKTMVRSTFGDAKYSEYLIINKKAILQGGKSFEMED